ncbi:MAG: archease [Candidatus Pacearchaeota archaeon]|jgi:SHS2 domain-containing protein
MKYKFIPHTADIKFQAYGKNLNEAFENSALAMFNVMYDGKIKGKIKKKVNADGKDLEELLYNFLEKLIILMDAENIFLSEIKVKIDSKNFKLTGELVGDKSSNYPISLDVKAITYNDMFVKKLNGKWVCQAVIDV